MFVTVGVVLLAVAILSFVGLPIVYLLPVRHRGSYLLAAPLVGVALLVVVLHLTIPFAGVRATFLAPVIAVVLAAAAVIITRRLAWRPDRENGGDAGWVVALSVIAAGLALIPSIAFNAARVIQPSDNNDAFYFVTLSEWLSDHSGTTLPDIGLSPSTGLDSPAFGPAFSTITQSLRFGQELVTSWITTVTGLEGIVIFTPLLVVWFALLVPAAWLVGRSLGLSLRGRIVVSLAVITASSLLALTTRQNADAMLGVPLALATVAAFIAAVSPKGEGRPPLWLPALFLSATIGVYSEYIPILGVVLGSLTLWRARATIPAALARAAIILGISLVIGAFAWFRAIRALFFFGDIAAAAPTVLSPLQMVSGLLGSLGNLIENTDGLARLAVVVGVIGLGAIALIGGASAVVAGGPTLRALAVAVFIGGFGFALLLAFRGNEYMFRRAVDLVLPFAIIVVVSGIVIGRGVLRRPLARVAAVGSLLVWVVVNIAVFTIPAVSPTLATRTVDDDFIEAERWIDSVADDSGSNVTVMTVDFFDQLWISERLDDLPDVSYPFLRGDFGYRGRLDMESFWDGTVGRYLLVGRGVPIDPLSGAIVASNERFALVDRSLGDVVVASPYTPNAPWTEEQGTNDVGASATFSILVVLDGARDVVVNFQSRTDAVSLALIRSPDGAWTSTVAGVTVASIAGADPVSEILSVSVTGLHVAEVFDLVGVYGD